METSFISVYAELYNTKQTKEWIGMGLRGAAGETGKAFDWDVTKRLFSYLAPYKRQVWLALAAM